MWLYENHQIIHFSWLNCIPVKLVFVCERHKKCGLQKATPARTTSPFCIQIAGSLPLRPPPGPAGIPSPRLTHPWATVPSFAVSLNNSCNFLFGSWTQRLATCSNPTPGLAGKEWVLSQNLHCLSVIEGTHMRPEESHPLGKESLVVVSQISRQATLRCPWT